MPVGTPAPLPTPVVAPAPLDPARLVRCPICQAPSALAAEDCQGCGLMFRSRVPATLRARQDYVALRPLGDV